MAECPKCGKPLVKQSTKCRYHCENADCPVIYVKYPHVPALRVVITASSTGRRTAQLQARST